MNFLISGNGQVLGKTFSADNARRHVIVAKDDMHAVTSITELAELPLPVQHTLMDTHYMDDIRAVWGPMKKESYPYWGKVSVQRVVRSLFPEDNPTAAYSKDELLDAIPGATWISITTAFSMLKNKKYARGNIVNINQVKGKYRRTS